MPAADMGRTDGRGKRQEEGREAVEMPFNLDSLAMPAGDTAGAGTTQDTPAEIGTGTAKKRPRRPSTGRNSTRTSSSAEADGDSDSEFSINSSDGDIRPTSTSSCASTGRGALMTKQKASTRARASTTNKKRRADDEPGMTVSAVSRATSIRGGQQQWTELTAVCHVFSDEVYKYMNPICIEEAEDSISGSSKRRKKQPPHLSMGEKKHLNVLVERVKERVDRQSGVVLENRKLVKAAKAAKCKVRDLRNDIMITRLLTGKLEAEVSSLEKQVRRRKGDEKKMQQASNFLSAIEALARNGSSHSRTTTGS